MHELKIIGRDIRESWNIPSQNRSSGVGGWNMWKQGDKFGKMEFWGGGTIPGGRVKEAVF